jgi:hypothetical protein
MLKYSFLIIFIAIILISGCTINNNTETCENIIIFTDWSECNNGFQERTKTTISCTNHSLINEETEMKSCETSCIPDLSCTNWSECSKSGNQTRVCTDLNNCPNAINANVQACTFNSPCSFISDSKIREECNSLVYKSNKYCYNITNSAESESCFFSYAYIYSDLGTCNFINNSISRNTCKAAVSLDNSYCNILVPANRSDCSYELDLRYQYLAMAHFDSSFCNYIQDSIIKASCLANSKAYETYRDDFNDCKSFSYENNSLIYQTSKACYLYHIKNSNNDSICSYVSYFIKDDCDEMMINNLTFCYDQSGYTRDWCLANFAYYNNDINICRDALNEEDCFYTIGYWLKEKEYCLAIEDEPRRNICITSYVSFCEENINNCPSSDYCSLITDATSKNNCILKKVKNEIKFLGKEW